MRSSWQLRPKRESPRQQWLRRLQQCARQVSGPAGAPGDCSIVHCACPALTFAHFACTAYTLPYKDARGVKVGGACDDLPLEKGVVHYGMCERTWINASKWTAGAYS